MLLICLRSRWLGNFMVYKWPVNSGDQRGSWKKIHFRSGRWGKRGYSGSLSSLLHYRWPRWWIPTQDTRGESRKQTFYFLFHEIDNSVDELNMKVLFLGKQKVKIFAGAQRQRGVYRPTGVGRLCNWVPDQNQPLADEFSSFGAYQRTLTLECDHGEPGFVEWVPDEDTPDTVYYQVSERKLLHWQMNSPLAR